VLGVELIVWEDPLPTLRRPVLVAAFEGWNDAGDAASLAARLRALALLLCALLARRFPEADDARAGLPSYRMSGPAGRRLDAPALPAPDTS
jgi:hypothetical protein